MLNSSDQEKPLKQPEKKNLKNVLYRRTNLRLIVVFLLETTIIYHVTATGLAKVTLTRSWIFKRVWRHFVI